MIELRYKNTPSAIANLRFQRTRRAFAIRPQSRQEDVGLREKGRKLTPCHSLSQSTSSHLYSGTFLQKLLLRTGGRPRLTANTPRGSWREKSSLCRTPPPAPYIN